MRSLRRLLLTLCAGGLLGGCEGSSIVGGGPDGGLDAPALDAPTLDAPPVDASALDAPPADAPCAEGLLACAARCADPRTDRLNCGACGVQCEAGFVCVDRACQLSCAGSKRACGGTCRDLQSDNAHCGACGTVCPPGNTCAAGSCVVSCGAGLSQCGSTCVNTQTDNAHCGACGTACPAGQVCSGGVCGTTCAAPATTCGAAPTSFCANTAIDPAHCGACGAACALANTATQGCTAGACAIVRCSTGFGDCDGLAANGCETDTATSAAHCGGCGRACALPNATTRCSAGACTLAACAAGFADCDGDAANGCEVNTSTNNTRCGACGTVCPSGTVCSAGQCGVSCQTGQRNCAGTCTNLANDPLHCGACGTACPAGPNATTFCAAGVCGAVCATSFGDCDNNPSNGCEVDTRASAAHCGACGRACQAGSPCILGVCGCPAGQRGVGGVCVASAAVPRPVAPMSLGDVTQRRPTLRWVLPTGFDGAVVELCSDRPCTAVIETLTVTGTSARPTTDLPPRSVVFWRLRGRVGSAVDTLAGPTWLFHVPARSASTAVDTSFNPHLDLNGDGFDDLVVGAKFATVGQLSQMGTVTVFHGSSDGVPTAPARLLQSPGRFGGDAFGTSVAGAGDVNGDGFGDLLVGAPGGDPSGLGQAGEVHVFHGGPTGVPGAATTVLAGGARSEELGTSVAGAGDVNGDGYADVVAGAPAASPGGRASAGEARIYQGSASGVATTAARVLEGVAAGDYLGYSVASAGDVNGDGFGDLALGSPFADPGGRTNAGGARVYLGSLTGIPSAAAVTWEGALAEDTLGISVAGAGDLNGDGLADLVLGANGADPGGRSNAGTASVFHGSAQGIPTAPTRVLEGNEMNGGFGRSVAFARDVDGDGFGDLIVGAFGARSARVFHGGSAGVEATPTRELAGPDRFGWSVAGAGDLNRDGFADVVVGSPFGSPGGPFFVGSASVYLGSSTGLPTTAATVRTTGVAGDDFGGSVARARPLRRALVCIAAG